MKKLLFIFLFNIFLINKSYSLIEVDAHLIKIVSYPFYLTLITVLTSIIMFNIGFRKDTLFKIIRNQF